MLENKPLVSIFIPYYNDEKFLGGAIEAVLNNSYENFELILLNHATTDSCREIAHSYNDTRIRHIDIEKNTGAGGGLLFEEMLKVAKGKYIKPLCADDVLRKDGLGLLVDYMENNLNKDFAFGNVEYIDVEGNDLKDNWFTSRKGFSIQKDEIDYMRMYVYGISSLPYIGSIVKRDVFANIKIDKTLVMMFDMSLWLSLLCNGCKMGFVDKLVADYRIHEGQVSSLSHKLTAERISWFEHSVFWKIFLSIKDIELVKKFCSESEYLDKLTDVRDIPFVVIQAYLLVLGPFSYIYLNELLNDDRTRRHLEEVFCYGVKELRDDCKKGLELNKKEVYDGWFRNFKRSLYSKNPKNLRMRELYFLLGRKLVEIITLKRFRPKKNKKYSL